MNRRQISAGAVPPVILPSERLSSRPTQTPTTRLPANPTNSASRLFWVVPVLPNVGVDMRRAAAGTLVGRGPQQFEHRRPVAPIVQPPAAREEAPTALPLPRSSGRPRGSTG